MGRFAEERALAVRAARAADLRASGVSNGQLRGKRWQRVSRGVHIPAVDAVRQDRMSGAQRILNCLPLLTEGFGIGGWAAAYVLGADWLDGIDPLTGRVLPIDIVGPTCRRNTPEVTYRCIRGPVSFIDYEGIRLTDPLRTAIDGARWAATDEDAHVFCDAMIWGDVLTPQELRRGIRSVGRMHGIGRARDTAARARDNVWSPWESRLRYAYTVEAGCPEPLLNVRIFDEDGMLLGHPDLFDLDAALAIEFDGEDHRDRRQHRRDNIREEKFEDAGVTVVRTDSLDLRPVHRRATLARIQGGYERGMRRDRRHDRWVVDPRIWTGDVRGSSRGSG